MIETYSSELISEYLNGQASELPSMIRLMSQAFFVLFAGIIIWRISTAFGKPKQVNQRKKFVRSKYKDHWYN
ncbi:MAG TPA: hypothetical protein EYG85_04620 [Crocinitomix sp.]|nr:hypothetical protein [Crocinitomix sp.]